MNMAGLIWPSSKDAACVHRKINATTNNAYVAMHDKCRITWLSDILITQCIAVAKTVISTNTSFDDTARKVLHEKCPCADMYVY